MIGLGWCWHQHPERHSCGACSGNGGIPCTGNGSGKAITVRLQCTAFFQMGSAAREVAARATYWREAMPRLIPARNERFTNQRRINPSPA